MSQDFSQAIFERFGVQPRLGGGLAADTGEAGGATLARMLDRRTIRRFRPQPVGDETLEVLLACAQSAPSKSDLQAYSVVVVKHAETRRAIARLLPAMPWVAEAPTFLVWLADMRRNQRVCQLRGRPHHNNTLDGFFNASVDAALAMQTFVLAAEAVGLGCCAISQLRGHMQAVTDLLALPPGVFPLAGLCVGWPADGGELSMRLPPTLVVHTDRYDDSQLEAGLEAYDRRRHARRPIPPEKQKNPADFPPTPYCPWSDQVSRQLSRRERPDFGQFLRRHGFELD